MPQSRTNLIVAMASIGRCVSDAPHIFILWGNFTFPFVLRPPVNSLQTVLADRAIFATLPLVSTELSALAGDSLTGPIDMLLIYPVQKAMTPNMLMPDELFHVCALLDSD